MNAELVEQVLAAFEESTRPLELLGEVLDADRVLVSDREVEALRRTARAAFEDWLEARTRAEVRDRGDIEKRGGACSDVRLRS